MIVYRGIRRTANRGFDPAAIRKGKKRMKKLRTLRTILALVLTACMILGTLPAPAEGGSQNEERVNLKTEDGREFLIVASKEDSEQSSVNVEVFILPENEGETPVPFVFTEEDAALKDKIVDAIGKNMDDVYFVRNGEVSVTVTPEEGDKAALEVTVGDVHSEIPPVPDVNIGMTGIEVSGGEELAIEIDGYENLQDELDEKLEENEYPFVDKITVNADTVTEEMAYVPAVPPEGDAWYATTVTGVGVYTNQRDAEVNTDDITVTAQNAKPEQPDEDSGYQYVLSQVVGEGISGNIKNGNAALSAKDISVDMQYRETDPELDDYATVNGKGVELYVSERLYWDEEPGDETFTASVATNDIAVTGDMEGKDVTLLLTGIGSQAGVNGDAEITAGDVGVEGKTDCENAEVQLVGIRSETNLYGETHIEAGSIDVGLTAAGGNVKVTETAVQVTVNGEDEEGSGAEEGPAAQAEVTTEDITMKGVSEADNAEVTLTGIGAQIGPDSQAEITSGDMTITAAADSADVDGVVIGLEGGSGTFTVGDIAETVTVSGDAEADGVRFDIEDAELKARVEGSITEEIQTAGGVYAHGVQGGAAGGELGLAAGDVDIGISLTGGAEEPAGKESADSSAPAAGDEDGESGEAAQYEGSFAYVNAGGVSLEMYGTDAVVSVGNVMLEVTTEEEYDGLNLTLTGVEFNSYRDQGQAEAKSEVTIDVENVIVSADVKTDEIDTNISGLNISASGDTTTKVTAEDVTAEITATTGEKADDYYEHIPSALTDGIQANGEGTSVKAQDVSASAVVKDGSFDAYASGVIANGGATVEAASVTANAASEGGEAHAAAVEIDYYGTVSVQEDVTATASSGNEEEGSEAYGIRILDYAYGADEEYNYSITAEAGGDVTAEGDAGAGIYITHEDDANPVSVVVGGSVSGPDAAIVIENRAEHFTVEDIDITLWAAEPGEDGDIAVVKDAGRDKETGEWLEVVDDDATAALLESINYIVKTGEELSYDSLSTKDGKSVTLFENQYHTANEEEDIAITVNGSTNQILEGIYYNADQADTLKKVSELRKDDSGRFLMTMKRAGGMLLGLKWHTVHTWGEYVSDENATCENDGTKTAHCTYPGCTATNTVTDEGSALGHSFTKYVSDSNATCEEDGTKTAHCDHEGCSKIDTVPHEGSRLPHTAGDPGTENYTEPTETSEGGYDTVVRCVNCNEVLETKHTVIPKIEREIKPVQPAAPADEPVSVKTPLRFEKTTDTEAVKMLRDSVNKAAETGDALSAFPDDIKAKLNCTTMKGCDAWKLKGDWDGASAAEIQFKAEGMDDGKVQLVLGFGDNWLALDTMEVKDGIIKITLQAEQIKALLAADSILIVILAE